MFDKAVNSGADVVILDLEDSVAPTSKTLARAEVRRVLRDRPSDQTVFVRLNPVNNDDGSKEPASADLECISDTPPDGVVIPKVESYRTLDTVAEGLSETIGVIPLTPETASGVVSMSEISRSKANIVGLMWGGEDLATSIGAAYSRDPLDNYISPLQTARNLMLFCAHALGVPAIETVFPNFRNSEGLQKCAGAARRDGFSGMLAIHPNQVKTINTVFTPSADELLRAQAIVDAFKRNAGTGVLNVNGEMVDRPHYERAMRLTKQWGSSDDNS